MKPQDVLTLTIIALMFISGAYIYPAMPDTMATHWDVNGNVNGHSTKLVGVFLIPVMTLGLFLLFKLIPHIAVYKKNIESFKKYYNYLITGLVIFLGAIQTASLLLNMGYSFDMSYIVMPALGILLYGVGTIFEKTKKNFFIGIRTPWTLSSDLVWEKTHLIASKIFRALGVFAIISIFIPQGMLIFIALTMIAVTYIFIYSFVEFEKEKKNKPTRVLKKPRLKNVNTPNKNQKR